MILLPDAPLHYLLWAALPDADADVLHESLEETATQATGAPQRAASSAPVLPDGTRLIRGEQKAQMPATQSALTC